MQDPSESMGNSVPNENDESNTSGTSHGDESKSDSESGFLPAATVLVELTSGVVGAFGEFPEELKRELKFDRIDFGIVPIVDRKEISTFLASVGNAATVGGNLANAYAGLEGLYRTTDLTQAILNAGGTLAIKDGANIGTVLLNGQIFHQARFTPVTKVTAAQKLAAIGPALAMVALQMQLSEAAGLVRTNIALTRRVVTATNHAQWSTLTALVQVVDKALHEAQVLEAVTQHVWEPVASKREELLGAYDQYRRNVGDHVQQIRQLDAHGRREYLETNAAAIVFDAHALRSSLEAWTKYQVLRAAKVRAAGREDEVGLVEVIERETRAGHSSALAEMTSLVSSLTRELRIIAELPGRATVPLTRNRKDSEAARLTCTQLLKAIQPLADALHPPVSGLTGPDITCSPKSLDPDPYVRILRWFLEDGENFRVLAFPDQLDIIGSFGSASGGAREKVAATKDKAVTVIDKGVTTNLVAVTDRRVIMAKTGVLRKQGKIGQAIPIDQVRYVRAPAQDGNGRSAIDVITRNENIRMIFRVAVEKTQVEELAATLAEAMTIPDAERNALLPGRCVSLEAAKESDDVSTEPTEPIEFKAPTDDVS